MSENPIQPEPESPLEHIIDDEDPKEKSREWAAREILKGRAFDELTAELVAQGWSHQEAEEHVEFARQATRKQRGLISRDDIARKSASRYQWAIRSTSLIGLLSLIMIIAIIAWKYFWH